MEYDHVFMRGTPITPPPPLKNFFSVTPRFGQTQDNQINLRISDLSGRLPSMFSCNGVDYITNGP